jgi:hypothetical protein
MVHSGIGKGHPLRRIFLPLIIVLAWGRLTSQTVVINEIMNRNVSLLQDAHGHFHDWIELYNPSLQAVRLDGYRLSDDPDRPDKWTLPWLEIQGKSFALIRASDEDPRGQIAFETVVDRGDAWRVQPGSATLSRSWYTARFNDASWSEGPSGFGTGDMADSTVVPRAPSLFARRTFLLSGQDSITFAVLHVDYQDGFVAYINGREVARRNMGPRGDHPVWNRVATTPAETRMRRGDPPVAFPIAVDASLFREGANVLAIQVHAAAAGTGDLTLIPFLTIGKISSRPFFRVRPGLPLFTPPLDANFKIKTGETLVFSDPAGVLLDSLTVPALPASVSWGRFPNGRNAWRMMSSPTPGTANRQPFVTGVTPAPRFDPPAGFYPGECVISVSPAAPGDSVRITTDGSDPSEDSPPVGRLFTMKKTGVLRGRAFRPGLLQSPITTQTFLIGERKTLPVVSLTVNPPDLWDWESGIYVMGPGASPDNPNFGANFWQDWERPTHVEFFETDGSPAFSLDAGIRIYGGWSRAFDQRSLALYFRDVYEERRIENRLFPDMEIRRFETFLLRNSGNDWQYTMFRDGLMQTLVRGRTAIDALAYRPASVFLNGEYWGIMNIREKPDAHTLASHHGVDPDGLDLLAYEGNSEISVIEGSAHAFSDMTATLVGMDMSSNEAYVFVHDRIDLDNFMDYMCAEIYFGNTDWPGNNIKFWKSRTPGARWRWILYDTDFGFGLYDADGVHHNTLAFALDPAGSAWPNPPASTFLFRRLVENPGFRNRFINRAADHLNSTFDKNRVRSVIDSLSALIAPEIPFHRSRWPGSAQGWEVQVDRLRDFADRRVPVLRSNLMSQFGLSGTARITLNVSDAAGGGLRVNSLDLNAFPWSGTYFKRVAVEITARPNPGYRFAEWSVPGIGDSITVSVNLSGPLSLTARFEPDSGRHRPVINEINYHSADSFDTGDWVELHNPSDASLDLSGWIFHAGLRNPPFEVPAGSVIDARGYTILAADPAAFRLLHPDVPCPVIGIPVNFKNSGDSLTLTDHDGDMVDSIFFSDENPWPDEADGSGSTLSLDDPRSDNADPASWSASRQPGGTPGRPNSYSTSAPHLPPESPADFRLQPVYPNPFNASTMLRWEIPARSRVSVAVYDIRGRLVGTVAEGDYEAGKYSVRWDARSASGVYIVKMKATLGGRRFEASSKMVCIR